MKVAIIGRTEILYDTAEALLHCGHDLTCILTAKEAPEYTRTRHDFKNLATQHDIPFATGSRIKEHHKFLKNSKAEIAISINYTGIIPQEVIDLFPLGILNAHGGDLPRYRGNACQAWAILNGERRIGLCIHKMIGGEVDSGDIIMRDYMQIDIDTKITQVWDWMTKRTPGLMVDAVKKLSEEPDYYLEKQSDNPKDTLRCYPRIPNDGCIKWQDSASNIVRLINASNKPYSGAFCYLQGIKLTIWSAYLADIKRNYCAAPGQIIQFNTDSVIVSCGIGEIEVFEVEYQGFSGNPRKVITSIRQRLT